MGQPQLVGRGQAVPRRVMSDGKISKVIDYFGGASLFRGPQAYMVAARNYVTRPHFHPVDQFQVLYGAEGSLFGRWPVGELLVHYSDAYTVYGPLVSADPPLRYLTLRAEPTDATEYMPESRRLLPGSRGRSMHSEPDLSLAAGLPPGQTAASTLLHDDRDGLEASYLAAGAGAGLAVPEAGPAGQFLVVVEGTIESHEAWYGAESIGWQPPGDPGLEARAGTGGAGLLVLRYPWRPAPGAEHRPPGESGSRRAQHGQGAGDAA